MKNQFMPPVVKHDIEVIPNMVLNAKGEQVEACLITISGPGLPGIDYPYNDPTIPNILQRYSLTDLVSQPVKVPAQLWEKYWQQGQLCILTGDIGTGKSTLAIQLARSIAEGLNFPHHGPLPRGEGENRPSLHPSLNPPTDAAVSTIGSQEGINGRKVLFIGFELSAADMLMRYGSTEVSENFMYANLNADAFATGRVTLGERLVSALDDMVAETEATVVIIDQPDRMYLQPAMWNYFMLKLNQLKVQKGVSVLITLNNKPRNLGKAPAIGSMYKSHLLAPHADSIVSIANHCRQLGKRYIKLLKNTALPFDLNALPEVIEIGLQNSENLLQPPVFLLVQACGVEPEDKVLLPTATERRNNRMIEAEKMRYGGMGFKAIAEAMELPERTVRSWVGFIKVGSIEGRRLSEVENKDCLCSRHSSLETMPFLAAYRRFPMREALHFFPRERNEAKKAPG